VAADVLPTRSTVRFWTASVDGSDNQMDMGLEPWRLRVVDDDDPDPPLGQILLDYIQEVDYQVIGESYRSAGPLGLIR
jgi:hypothetical protein